MFESLVLGLLRKVLEPYFDNVSDKNLVVGTRRLELKKLAFKRSLFGLLGLDYIEVDDGSLDFFEVKLNLSSLRSASLHVTVKGVSLAAVTPTSQQKADELRQLVQERVMLQAQGLQQLAEAAGGKDSQDSATSSSESGLSTTAALTRHFLSTLTADVRDISISLRDRVASAEVDARLDAMFVKPFLEARPRVIFQGSDAAAGKGLFANDVLDVLEARDDQVKLRTVQGPCWVPRSNVKEQEQSQAAVRVEAGIQGFSISCGTAGQFPRVPMLSSLGFRLCLYHGNQDMRVAIEAGNVGHSGQEARISMSIEQVKLLSTIAATLQREMERLKNLRDTDRAWKRRRRLAAALANYEAFHKLPRGSAKPVDVERSSEGVGGWAAANHAGSEEVLSRARSEQLRHLSFFEDAIDLTDAEAVKRTKDEFVQLYLQDRDAGLQGADHVRSHDTDRLELLWDDVPERLLAEWIYPVLPPTAESSQKQAAEPAKQERGMFGAAFDWFRGRSAASGEEAIGIQQFKAQAEELEALVVPSTVDFKISLGKFRLTLLAETGGMDDSAETADIQVVLQGATLEGDMKDGKDFNGLPNYSGRFGFSVTELAISHGSKDILSRELTSAESSVETANCFHIILRQRLNPDNTLISVSADMQPMVICLEETSFPSLQNFLSVGGETYNNALQKPLVDDISQVVQRSESTQVADTLGMLAVRGQAWLESDEGQEAWAQLNDRQPNMFEVDVRLHGPRIELPISGSKVSVSTGSFMIKTPETCKMNAIAVHSEIAQIELSITDEAKHVQRVIEPFTLKLPAKLADNKVEVDAHLDGLRLQASPEIAQLLAASSRSVLRILGLSGTEDDSSNASSPSPISRPRPVSAAAVSETPTLRRQESVLMRDFMAQANEKVQEVCEYSASFTMGHSTIQLLDGASEVLRLEMAFNQGGQKGGMLKYRQNQSGEAELTCKQAAFLAVDIFNRRAGRFEPILELFKLELLMSQTGEHSRSVQVRGLRPLLLNVTPTTAKLMTWYVPHFQHTIYQSIEATVMEAAPRYRALNLTDQVIDIEFSSPQAKGQSLPSQMSTWISLDDAILPFACDYVQFGNGARLNLNHAGAVLLGFSGRVSASSSATGQSSYSPPHRGSELVAQLVRPRVDYALLIISSRCLVINDMTEPLRLLTPAGQKVKGTHCCGADLLQGIGDNSLGAMLHKTISAAAGDDDDFTLRPGEVASVQLGEPLVEWVPIRRGTPMPRNAVDAGEGTADARRYYIGRVNGEPGWIEAKGNTMWTFSGHLQGEFPQAEVLVVASTASKTWTPLQRGQLLPRSAVETGSTHTDGPCCVGRYNGEPGKINRNPDRRMWSFWGSKSNQSLSAEILLIQPGPDSIAASLRVAAADGSATGSVDASGGSLMVPVQCGSLHCFAALDSSTTPPPASIRMQQVRLLPALRFVSSLPCQLYIEYKLPDEPDEARGQLQVPSLGDAMAYDRMPSASSSSLEVRLRLEGVHEFSTWTTLLLGRDGNFTFAAATRTRSSGLPVQAQVCNCNEVRFSCLAWLLNRTGWDLGALQSIPPFRTDDGIMLLGPEEERALKLDSDAAEKALSDGRVVCFRPATLPVPGSGKYAIRCLEIVPKYVFQNSTEHALQVRRAGNVPFSELTVPAGQCRAGTFSQGPFKFRLDAGGCSQWSSPLPTDIVMVGAVPFVVGSRVWTVEVRPDCGLLCINIREGSDYTVYNTLDTSCVVGVGRDDSDSAAAFTVEPQEEKHIGWLDPFGRDADRLLEISLPGVTRKKVDPLAGAVTEITQEVVLTSTLAGSTTRLELRPKNEEKPPTTKLEVVLPKMGLSLVQELGGAREFLYLELVLLAFSVEMSPMEDTSIFELSIEDGQLDRQNAAKRMMAIVVGTRGRSGEPLLRIFGERQRISSQDQIFRRIAVNVQQLEIAFDGGLIDQIVAFSSELEVTDESTGPKARKRMLDTIKTQACVSLLAADWEMPALSQALEIDELEVAAIHLDVWCRIPVDSLTFLPRQLRRVLDSLASPIELDGAKLRLSEKRIEKARGSVSDLVAALADAGDVMRSVGSVLGNSSLMKIPSAPIRLGGKFAKFSLEGVGAVADKAMDVVEAVAIQQPQSSDGHAPQGSASTRQIHDLRSGVAEAVGELGDGVSGVLDIVRDPLQGARENGVQGFVRGVGTGIVHSVAKPVVGIGRALADVSAGVAAQVQGVSAKKKRKVTRLRRLPRLLAGSLRTVLEYSQIDAAVASFVDLHDNGHGIEAVIPVIPVDCDLPARGGAGQTAPVYVLVLFSDELMLAEVRINNDTLDSFNNNVNTDSFVASSFRPSVVPARNAFEVDHEPATSTLDDKADGARPLLAAVGTPRHASASFASSVGGSHPPGMTDAACAQAAATTTMSFHRRLSDIHGQQPPAVKVLPGTPLRYPVLDIEERSGEGGSVLFLRGSHPSPGAEDRSFGITLPDELALELLPALKLVLQEGAAPENKLPNSDDWTAEFRQAMRRLVMTRGWREDGSEAVFREFDVWQIQRRGLLGWRRPFCLWECEQRCGWMTEGLRERHPLLQVQEAMRGAELPPLDIHPRWTPHGDWQYLRDQETDEAGWQYATTWSSVSWRAAPAGLDLVRRRLWRRDYRLAAEIPDLNIMAGETFASHRTCCQRLKDCCLPRRGPPG
eukprot:TRINITY_DN47203_c0_g1_i1.p1 TRINITY_DN47203_c0_g1~~TRINITY_DN47203_c0_g1_i1.p1  ORF type:complete len:2659 (+),score=557.61 TRINITY_DN47203_c0_g1_i1:88-8064(+)